MLYIAGGVMIQRQLVIGLRLYTMKTNSKEKEEVGVN